MAELGSGEGNKNWYESVKKFLGIKKPAALPPGSSKLSESTSADEQVAESLPGSNLPAIPEQKSLPQKVEKQLVDPKQVFSQALEEFTSSPDLVVIPAAPGNEEVRIFPKPGYFAIDHGMTMIDFNADLVPSGRRAAPSFYAAFLMKIGQAEELRFVTLPVSLFPGRDQYNQQLVDEIISQGIPKDAVQENATYKKAHGIFSYLDLRYLPTMRFLMTSRKFLTEDPDPEEPRHILKSGWETKTGRAPHLTIIGDPANLKDPRFFYEQGLYNYVNFNDVEQYHGIGIKTISDTFNSNSVSGFEGQVLDKVLTANHAKI